MLWHLIGRVKDAEHPKMPGKTPTSENYLALNVNIAELRNRDPGNCLSLHVHIFPSYAINLLKNIYFSAFLERWGLNGGSPPKVHQITGTCECCLTGKVGLR